MPDDEIEKVPADLELLFAAERAAPPLKQDVADVLATKALSGAKLISMSLFGYGLSLLGAGLVGAAITGAAWYLNTDQDAEAELAPAQAALMNTIAEQVMSDPIEGDAPGEEPAIQLSHNDPPSPAAVNDHFSALGETKRQHVSDRRRAPPKPDRPTQTSALAEEEALILAARQALLREQSLAALARLDEHKKAFPHGQLSEERDALRIRVFLSRNDLDAAKRALDRFADTYPKSYFLPQLSQAMDE